MKKTIEEVAEELVPNRIGKTPFGTSYEIIPTKERNAFIRGAKHQSEQSEEESLEAENKRLKDEIKALDKIIKNFDVNH